MRTLLRTVLFIFACGLLFGAIFTSAHAGRMTSQGEQVFTRTMGSIVGNGVEPQLLSLAPQMGAEVAPALQPVECGPGSEPYAPCLVTLVEPTTVPVCGSNNDEVVFPDQVGAVVEYDSGWVNGARSITYVSLPDYYIDGFNGRWTFGLVDSGPCLVTLVEPTTIPVCGLDNDEVVFPDQVGAEVDWDSGWDQGTRIIRYRSLPDYYISSSNGYWEYTLTENGPTCPVSIVEGTVTEVCGPNNDLIEYPNLPEGLVIASDSGWIDGMRMFSFAAEPGYEIVGSIGHGYGDQDGPCAVQVVEPTQGDVCGYSNDLITLFDQPEGVVLLSDTGWFENERRVSYGAEPLFYISNQSVYDFSDFGILCPTVPVEPTQAAVCGPDNDTITIPDQPEGVVLGADTTWVGNVRTITFVATEGFAIEGESVFEFTDADEQCPLETPTPTPSPTSSPPPAETPTVVPTVTPTQPPPIPTESPSPTASFGESKRVTGLPNTGSGGDSASGMVALIALGAIVIAMPFVRRAPR